MLDGRSERVNEMLLGVVLAVVPLCRARGGNQLVTMHAWLELGAAGRAAATLTMTIK